MQDWRKLLAAIAILAAALSVPGVQAGPLAASTWSQFSFGNAGDLARGCDPADPAGAFCIPSFGTPVVPLDAPPWTFTALANTTLVVVDVFESGDRFEVFDSGVSLGLTSTPAAAGSTDCGDDPVICLGFSGMSSGMFVLGAGSHSITIVPTLAPSGGGAGYLFVGATAVDEPGETGLLAGAVIALALVRRRARSAARRT
jgi:hypothetical protein